MRPTDVMDALANGTSAFENRTGREIVDDWVNELVSIAEGDPDRLAAPTRPRSELRAVRFTLTLDDPLVNEGRIADATFVFSANSDEEIAALQTLIASDAGMEELLDRFIDGDRSRDLLDAISTKVRTIPRVQTGNPTESEDIP